MYKKDWVPDLSRASGPKYVAIAEAIAADTFAGELAPGDRLPPQRYVAAAIGVDVSAISRGYAEATRRGYVEAHVGKGTFVRDPAESRVLPDPRRMTAEDPRMNMPPEPDDPALVKKMQDGFAHVSANIVPLLRYQAATGSEKDHEIAKNWMHANGMQFSEDRLAIAPGSHAAIEAALRVVMRPNTVVLCESVTYPGIRAIARGLGLELEGLEEDADGIQPEALREAIARHDHVVLYLNPTLRNPTTHTMPAGRRREIARILEAHDVQLIEDDAYRFVAAGAPDPISVLAPRQSWHIAGISKVFGAGLRLAYVQAPDRANLDTFVQLIRTSQGMTSPISLALLSTWMEDGTAADLQSFVRRASRERQALAADVLAGQEFCGDPNAFNIWLSLPDGISRADMLARMARQPIGLMPSDVFTVAGQPEDALRVCLGGPTDLKGLHGSLLALKSELSTPSWIA